MRLHALRLCAAFFVFICRRRVHLQISAYRLRQRPARDIQGETPMRHRLSNFLLAAAIACAPLASHAFETANGKRILVIGGQQAVSVMDPAQKYDFDPHHPAGHLRRAAQVRGRPRRAQALAGHVLTVNDDATVWTFAGPAREIPERRSGGRRRGQGLVRAHAQAEQGPGLDVHRFPQAREHQRRRPADAALHAQPSLRGLPQPAALVVRGQRQAGHGQRAQWRLWPAMADRSHRRLRPLPRQARRTQFPVRAGSLGRLLEGLAAREGAPGRHHLPRHHRELQPPRAGARRDRHRRQPVARGPGPARIGQGREDRPQGRHRHGRIRSEIQYAGQVHVRPEPAPRPGLRLRLRLLAEDLQRPRAADGQSLPAVGQGPCDRARHAAPRHGQGPRLPGQVKWPQGGIELEYVYVQGWRKSARWACC